MVWLVGFPWPVCALKIREPGFGTRVGPELRPKRNRDVLGSAGGGGNGDGAAVGAGGQTGGVDVHDRCGAGSGGSGSELPLLGVIFSQFPPLGRGDGDVDVQAPAGPVMTSFCWAMVAALAPVGRRS